MMRRWGWALLVALTVLVLLGRMGVWQALPSNERGLSETTAILFLQGSDYHQRVLSDINAAESSIIVALFSCVLPEDASAGHPVRQLLDALVRAHRQGVAVQVLLDYERRRDGSEDMVNHHAAMYLHERAVPLRRAEADRRAHMKTVVVDDVVVHIGSANWTWSAFRRNREHNVRIADAAIAAQARAACLEAWEAGSRQEDLGHE